MQGLGTSSCPCCDLGYFWAGFCVQGAPGPYSRRKVCHPLCLCSRSILIHCLFCPVQNLMSSLSLSCSLPHEEIRPGNIAFFFAMSIFLRNFLDFFYSCTCLHSSSLWQTSCIGGDLCSWGWFLFLSAFRSRGVYIIKQGIFFVYWAFPVVLSIGWRISGSNCSGSLQKGWGSSASGRAASQGQVPILLSPESWDPGTEIPV